MTFIFLPDANSEFREAISYHKQIYREYGDLFVAEFAMAIKSVCENPFSYPVVEHGARRRLMNKFKYSIIYKIHGDTVVILSIMHQHRRPGYWRKRMK